MVAAIPKVRGAFKSPQRKTNSASKLSRETAQTTAPIASMAMIPESLPKNILSAALERKRSFPLAKFLRKANVLGRVL